MKNNYFLALLVALLISSGSFIVKAQLSPTASKDVFDWTPYEDAKILELFYDALQNGRNYPTRDEIRNKFGFDMEFSRSHVRPKSILFNQSKQIDPTINPKRKLWMNLPGGIGKGNGGYPSSLFNNDTYSMWQYTHLFGSWNHSLFQAPGSWGDAAHKHGTDIFSGIKFFESWTPGSGDGVYSALISKKNPDGSFKYAEPLINILMYMGLDGINYNWEDNSYTNADVIAFHKELFRIAKEKNFTNFHIGIYTLNSSLTSGNKYALYYGNDPTDKTMDLMLNYAGGNFATSGIATSIAQAKAVNPNDINVYQGVWIVTMDRSWTAMNANATNKEMNLCLWGEHGQSRFMSYNTGTDAFNVQENYQKLLERGFSGGNRNPINRPTLSNTGNNWEQSDTKEPLSTFGGLASFVAERPTVQGKLPFLTNFQLGNGDRYHYKGKKTFGNWYNMGTQDYQPTYRWLVVNANTMTVNKDIQPSYTHRDAYTGGSTLQLKGTATTTGTDIILYRTNLEVSAANPKVSIAVKSSKEGVNPTNLYVILKKKDSDTWQEIAVGNTNDKVWEEMTLPMAGFATGDYIEYIGLRVKATASTPYDMYVGKLELKDDRAEGVAPIEDLIVEVKRETQSTMALKLNWKVTPFELSGRAQTTGLVYNDEANVDHFQIMYKNGENGRVSEVGRTSTWSTFVGDLEFDDSDGVDEPYIGVRSVSVDGKTYSPVVWVAVPRAEASNLPYYEVDSYCATEINPDAEGVDIARATRYLTEVKTIGLTDNLNYTATGPQTDGTQYVNATKDYSFTAAQGQTFDFFFKAFDAGDGLKYCFAKAYIDWDNNGDFNTETETVFDLGKIRDGTPEFQNPGVTRSFTVPERANTGKTRMRIVFSDAWFTHPGPCGQTAKGFSIDFTVNITGDNPPIITVDPRDPGIADQPEGINSGGTGVDSPIGDVKSFSKFYPNPVEADMHFENTQQIWIYTVDGKLAFTQKGNLETVNVSNLEKGIYVVKMLNNSVVRSAKMQKR